VTTPHNSEIRSALGFDFGLRRIGVATAQTITATASPVKTLVAHNGQPNWNQVDQLVAEWRPDVFVVGKPTHRIVDDPGRQDEHEMMEFVREFASRLMSRYGLDVFFVDEYLSSYAAEQQMGVQKQGRRSRQKKNTPELDAMAAKMILETWLSERKG